MKFSKNKKGFTIVELIIVIAVIGILTAVMVPTIVHLVNKANKASDDALVSNLNKASQLREVELGKPETMHDAVLGLEEYGYKLDALVAKSDQSLLYNLKENRFLLAGDAKEADKAQYWQIRDNADDKETYNIYASSKFNVSNVSGLKVGFDAGFQENISSVEYIGERDGLIRTNGSTQLTVETDHNVDHYGKSGDIIIKKVKMESFHEYGVVVGSVTIKAGHFVAEAGSTATSIVVAADAEASGVKVTNDSEETIYVSGKVASLSPESSADLETIENAQDVTNAVASVAGVGYGSFADALSHADLEHEIVMLQNIEFQSVHNIAKSFKLNLNGKTLSGKLLNEADRDVFCFNQKTTKYKLSIDGSVEGSKVFGLIYIGNKCFGDLEINGGHFENDVYCPLYINGSANEGSEFTIKNASFYSPYYNTPNPSYRGEIGKVYLAGHSISTFENCEIIGDVCGIEVRAGNVSFKDCIVKSNGGLSTSQANGNGGTSYGAALAVAQHTTNKDITVTIDGGEFTGVKAVLMVNPNNISEGEVLVTINSGKFNGAIENNEPRWTLDNKIVNA